MTDRISERLWLILLILFASTVVWAQLGPLYVILIWIMVLAGLINMRTPLQVKETAKICLLFLIGFLLYINAGAIIKTWLMPYEEWAVILSRLSLVGLLIPFRWYHQYKGSRAAYIAGGKWTNRIYFPFILKGPVVDPIWRFLMIFTAVSVLSFYWFIDWNRPGFDLLLLYACCFALINAVLEELLWRGYILSGFIGTTGEVKGIIIAGVGFGVYHYHLGFSWWICLLFALFGIMMSATAVRSQGLLPVIVMHFVLNILFVLSGMIFSP